MGSLSAMSQERSNTPLSQSIWGKWKISCLLAGQVSSNSTGEEAPIKEDLQWTITIRANSLTSKLNLLKNPLKIDPFPIRDFTQKLTTGTSKSPNTTQTQIFCRGSMRILGKSKEDTVTGFQASIKYRKLRGGSELLKRTKLFYWLLK